ncbi:MAG TPA: transposase [Stellaceae bacterium]|jgi:hypothetical protein|nr:transposase [Stellaceae bacterium]
MYIEAVPNRGSPPAILLRESYREGGRVRKRTLLNLSDWPPERIAGFKALLKGGRVVADLPAVATTGSPAAMTILRSLPHGHVAAALGTARKIGLDRLLGPDRNRCRNLVLALVIQRLLDPGSKLAAARALSPETAASSLGGELGLGAVDEEELYRALDWLAVRQPAIETALARRHLQGGTLVLYDVTSSYLEGRCCPLARFGYNRDGKHGKLQIVYGLLCAADGCPVAVEVFDGDTADPATLAAQVKKLKERFGLDRVVLVGDRGMITSARIAADLKPRRARLDHSPARPADPRARRGWGVADVTVRRARHGGHHRARLSRRTPDRLPQSRARRRARPQARRPLAATGRELARIAARVARRRQPLHGRTQIGLAVGAVIDKYKMAKHFALAITDTSFTFARNAAQIAAEAALDGLYAVRTSLPEAALDNRAAVKSYKSLALVERAFRALKTVDLMVRPVYHWLAERVRAHVFLCMLAYYLEWHMRQALAPMLYDETDKAAAEALRPSIVAKAERSPAARAKQTTGRTADGLPVHSFRTLLADLATLTRNTLATAAAPNAPFTLTTRPTPIQHKTFTLLGLAGTQ